MAAKPTQAKKSQRTLHVKKGDLVRVIAGKSAAPFVKRATAARLMTRSARIFASCSVTSSVTPRATGAVIASAATRRTDSHAKRRAS